MHMDFENGRFTVGRNQTSVKKATTQAMILRKLRAFLDASEPQLVYFLVRQWNYQQRAITYKELREAILNRDINAELLYEWQEDYSLFVTDHLQPAWTEAMWAAVDDLQKKFPGFYFDPMADGVRAWVLQRGAEFVTNSSTAQIDGLRALIQKAVAMEQMSVDQLARAIRPMVGLTRQQSLANLRYYENLLENGVSKKRALDLSTRYAARQHRYRGYNIARTELAFAYNQGSYYGTKQAQEAGYLGETVKIWCTADDERVCEICGSLDGKPIAMDDQIYYEHKDRDGNVTLRRINQKMRDRATGLVPPAHPSCRCAVLYEEISPPNFQKTT